MITLFVLLMFTQAQVLTVLISAGIPICLWFLNKPKHKQETQSLVVQQFQSLTEEMRKQIEDGRFQIELNKKEAERARVEAKLAQEQNDDCEFEHSITRMQLNKVLKRLDMMHWIKSSVFVLDDNETVIKVFTHRFRTIPVVHFKAFTNTDLFLITVQIEKPEIVVVDHELGQGRTAKDLINEFGYTPEIMVMSGTKENEIHFKDTDVRFFYKDKFYIRNITKAILEHLTIKNKINEPKND